MLANVALPSFLPHSFETLFGIFVIAAIEGFFLMRLLSLKFSEAYASSLSANWRSTIAGIPLAWLLWVAGWLPVGFGLSLFNIEFHPAVLSAWLQSAVFGGIMSTEWTEVGGAAARLTMLVPFWLGSVWIEKRTIAKRFPGKDSSLISKSVIQGNLASYCLFLLMGIFDLFSVIHNLPARKEHFEKRREQLEAKVMKAAGLEPAEMSPKPETLNPKP